MCSINMAVTNSRDPMPQTNGKQNYLLGSVSEEGQFPLVQAWIVFVSIYVYMCIYSLTASIKSSIKLCRLKHYLQNI